MGPSRPHYTPSTPSRSVMGVAQGRVPSQNGPILRRPEPEQRSLMGPACPHYLHSQSSPQECNHCNGGRQGPGPLSERWLSGLGAHRPTLRRRPGLGAGRGLAPRASRQTERLDASAPWASPFLCLSLRRLGRERSRSWTAAAATLLDEVYYPTTDPAADIRGYTRLGYH